MQSIDDLELGPVIGEGSYAVIRLARRKSDGTLFAIKIISKAHVLRLNKVSYVQQERNVLASVSHPNVISLLACFQDSRFLYFVLELATCGDLQVFIKKNGPLPQPVVEFYSLQLISALHYLRSVDVIHRDLKPSNVLIADNKSLKLTDFGTAKPGANNVAEQAQVAPSFAGTAAYVPPEMLESGEFSLATDLWSLGCVIYEMIEGSPPFVANTDYLTFQLILEGSVTFSEKFSEDARNLILSLLHKNPLERLGIDDVSSISRHPFFQNYSLNFVNTVDCPPVEIFQGLVFSRLLTWLDDDLTAEFDDISQVSSPAPRRNSISNTEKQVCLLSTDNRWKYFLNEGECVIFTGLIKKRTRITPWKTRRLVLTDKPRLFYVDVGRMEVRGEIPWSFSVDELTVVIPTSSKAQFFRIDIPKRKYILEAIDGNSGYTWQSKILSLQNS
ncbi:hypothetical protein RCL1_004880 [Eukaryota sp. TZLM3-RCL]